MERWKGIIAIVGGLGTAGGIIVTVLVSLAHNSAADVVRPVETRVMKIETTLGVVVPSMDHKLDLLIEAASQREWRDHRIVIPSPLTPADAGKEIP